MVALTESVELPRQCLPESATGAPRPDGNSISDQSPLQELVERIEQLSDPEARALARSCVQAVLELHGRGLARMMELLRKAERPSQEVLEELLKDQLLRALLLIHGLHPVDLETRLRGALEKVRPYMQSHGGNIELASLADEVARVRFKGTCQSCPSSAVTLELAVRRAVEEACPDLVGLELELEG